MKFICSGNVTMDLNLQVKMDDFYNSVENLNGDVFFHNLCFSKMENGICISTYDPRRIMAHVFSFIGNKYGAKDDGTLKVFTTAQAALSEIKQFHLSGLDEDIEFGLIRGVSTRMVIKEESKRFYI